MTWYTGHYGSWTKGDCVLHRINGTYNRNEIFKKAQEIANVNNEQVTIIAETGSASGILTKVYKINPQ